MVCSGYAMLLLGAIVVAVIARLLVQIPLAVELARAVIALLGCFSPCVIALHIALLITAPMEAKELRTKIWSLWSLALTLGIIGWLGSALISMTFLWALML